MPRNSPRIGALALALTLSTTARAAEPGLLDTRAGGQPVGPMPIPESSGVEPAPPEATAPQSEVPPQPPPQPEPEVEPPFGPVPPPVEAPSTVPPPAIVDPVEPVETSDAIQRGEWTRDTGATVMVGGGVVTVVGVILILAGFGATATALKKGSLDEHELIHTGRVTLSGLVISSLGAVALLAGIAVYASGRRQIARARGTLDFALSPSQRGVSVGMRARF